MDFEALKKKFAILRPSKTFPKGLDEADLKDSSINKFVNFLLASPKADGTPRSGLIIGDFGTGKTSEVIMSLLMQGIEVFYRNMSFTSVEDLTMMAPLRSIVPGEEDDVSKIALVEILADRFTKDTPFAIVFDEPFLAQPATKSMGMELMNEGSINDIKIPGLQACIAIANPPGSMYGRNVGFDIAMADRFYTLDMTKGGMKSHLWKYAIASDTRLGINERDLSGFFAAYESFDSSVQRLLPPRMVHFVLFALLLGLPPTGCLARLKGQVVELKNAADEVVTQKVFDALAKGLGVTNPSRLGDNPIGKVIRASLQLGENAEFVGPHGTGKTSVVKHLVKEEWAKLYPHQDMTFIKFSAPTTLPENNNIPLPIEGRLVNVIADRWKTKNPITVLSDEHWRAPWIAMCQFMEITQERSLGGMKIPLHSFFALNNPKEYAGMKYEVGNPSMPMVTRFWYHLEVGLDDSGWPEYLLAHYSGTPEGKIIATQVIEWWREDLKDVDRVRISSRTVERLIDAALAGVSLEWAKAYVDGDLVPVSLHSLEQRLANKPLARLSAIEKQIDFYENALRSTDQIWNDERNVVYRAFQDAELSQLEEKKELCIRLFAFLGRDYQKSMLMQGGARQKFWSMDVLPKANKLAQEYLLASAQPTPTTPSSKIPTTTASKPKAGAKKSSPKPKATTTK